jgi:hypothetical protein
VDYKARAYDPYLGRFTQPDTIIPGAGSPQAYNRYTYSNNNSENDIYPNGHRLSAPLITIGTSVNTMCNESRLVWCFYKRGLLPTGTYGVTKEQINGVMLAV